MTIKSRIAGALAVLTLATTLAIPSNEAQAKGWGLGAAIVGGAIVGSAVAASAAPYGGYYVGGYRRCRWERQYSAYGYYIGTVKVCRVY